MNSYEYNSERLQIELRRDDLQSIVWALENSGKIGLAKDVRDFLESKEGER